MNTINQKNNFSSFPTIIRIISFILLITFLAQDVTWAYPADKLAAYSSFKSNAEFKSEVERRYQESSKANAPIPTQESSRIESPHSISNVANRLHEMFTKGRITFKKYCELLKRLGNKEEKKLLAMLRLELAPIPKSGALFMGPYADNIDIKINVAPQTGATGFDRAKYAVFGSYLLLKRKDSKELSISYLPAWPGYRQSALLFIGRKIYYVMELKDHFVLRDAEDPAAIFYAGKIENAKTGVSRLMLDLPELSSQMIREENPKLHDFYGVSTNEEGFSPTYGAIAMGAMAAVSGLALLAYNYAPAIAGFIQSNWPILAGMIASIPFFIPMMANIPSGEGEGPSEGPNWSQAALAYLLSDFADRYIEGNTFKNGRVITMEELVKPVFYKSGIRVYINEEDLNKICAEAKNVIELVNGMGGYRGRKITAYDIIKLVSLRMHYPKSDLTDLLMQHFNSDLDDIALSRKLLFLDLRGNVGETLDIMKTEDYWMSLDFTWNESQKIAKAIEEVARLAGITSNNLSFEEIKQLVYFATLKLQLKNVNSEELVELADDMFEEFKPFLETLPGVAQAYTNKVIDSVSTILDGFKNYKAAFVMDRFQDQWFWRDKGFIEDDIPILIAIFNSVTKKTIKGDESVAAIKEEALEWIMKVLPQKIIADFERRMHLEKMIPEDEAGDIATVGESIGPVIAKMEAEHARLEIGFIPAALEQLKWLKNQYTLYRHTRNIIFDKSQAMDKESFWLDRDIFNGNIPKDEIATLLAETAGAVKNLLKNKQTDPYRELELVYGALLYRQETSGKKPTSIDSIKEFLAKHNASWPDWKSRESDKGGNATNFSFGSGVAVRHIQVNNIAAAFPQIECKLGSYYAKRSYEDELGKPDTANRAKVEKAIESLKALGGIYVEKAQRLAVEASMIEIDLPTHFLLGKIGIGRKSIYQLTHLGRTRRIIYISKKALDEIDINNPRDIQKLATILNHDQRELDVINDPANKSIVRAPYGVEKLLLAAHEKAEKDDPFHVMQDIRSDVERWLKEDMSIGRAINDEIEELTRKQYMPILNYFSNENNPRTQDVCVHAAKIAIRLGHLHEILGKREIALSYYKDAIKYFTQLEWENGGILPLDTQVRIICLLAETGNYGWVEREYMNLLQGFIGRQASTVDEPLIDYYVIGAIDTVTSEVIHLLKRYAQDTGTAEDMKRAENIARTMTVLKDIFLEGGRTAIMRFVIDPARQPSPTAGRTESMRMEIKTMFEKYSALVLRELFGGKIRTKDDFYRMAKRLEDEIVTELVEIYKSSYPGIEKDLRNSMGAIRDKIARQYKDTFEESPEPLSRDEKGGTLPENAIKLCAIIGLSYLVGYLTTPVLGVAVGLALLAKLFDLPIGFMIVEDAQLPGPKRDTTRHRILLKDASVGKDYFETLFEFNMKLFVLLARRMKAKRFSDEKALEAAKEESQKCVEKLQREISDFDKRLKELPVNERTIPSHERAKKQFAKAQVLIEANNESAASAVLVGALNEISRAREKILEDKIKIARPKIKVEREGSKIVIRQQVYMRPTPESKTLMPVSTKKTFDTRWEAGRSFDIQEDDYLDEREVMQDYIHRIDMDQVVAESDHSALTNENINHILAGLSGVQVEEKRLARIALETVKELVDLEACKEVKYLLPTVSRYLNLRINNIESILEHLRSGRARELQDLVSRENGKFIASINRAEALVDRGNRDLAANKEVLGLRRKIKSYLNEPDFDGVDLMLWPQKFWLGLARQKIEDSQLVNEFMALFRAEYIRRRLVANAAYLKENTFIDVFEDFVKSKQLIRGSPRVKSLQMLCYLAAFISMKDQVFRPINILRMLVEVDDIKRIMNIRRLKELELKNTFAALESFAALEPLLRSERCIGNLDKAERTLLVKAMAEDFSLSEDQRFGLAKAFAINRENLRKTPGKPEATNASLNRPELSSDRQVIYEGILKLKGATITDDTEERFILDVIEDKKSVYPLFFQIKREADGVVIGTLQFNIREGRNKIYTLDLRLVDINGDIAGASYQRRGIFPRVLSLVSDIMPDNSQFYISSIEEVETLKELASGKDWGDTRMGRILYRCGWNADLIAIDDKSDKPEDSLEPATAVLFDRNNEFPEFYNPALFKRILNKAITNIDRIGTIEEALVCVSLSKTGMPSNENGDTGKLIDDLFKNAVDEQAGPCHINHHVVNSIVTRCAESSEFADACADKIVSAIKNDSTDRDTRAMLAELTQRLKWESACGRFVGAKHFVQILSEKMKPEELLMHMRGCFSEYNNAIMDEEGNVYLRPGQPWIESLRGEDAIIPFGQDLRMRAVDRNWYYLEQDKKFIGVVFAALQKHTLESYLDIQIFDNANTGHGIGKAITRWFVEKIVPDRNDKLDRGYVTLYGPADESHINFVLSCKKDGLFDGLEATSTNAAFATAVVSDRGWIKFNTLEEAVKIKKDGSNLFIRGFVTKKLPSAPLEVATAESTLMPQPEVAPSIAIQESQKEDDFMNKVAALGRVINQGAVSIDNVPQQISGKGLILYADDMVKNDAVAEMVYMVSETDKINNSTLVLYGRNPNNINLVKKLIERSGANKGIKVLTVSPEDLSGFNGGQDINVEVPDDSIELPTLIRYAHARCHINNGNLLGVIRGKISEDYIAKVNEKIKEMDKPVPVVYFEAENGTYSFSEALCMLLAIENDTASHAVKEWIRKLPPISRENIEKVWQDYRRALEVEINA